MTIVERANGPLLLMFAFGMPSSILQCLVRSNQSILHELGRSSLLLSPLKNVSQVCLACEKYHVVQPIIYVPAPIFLIPLRNETCYFALLLLECDAFVTEGYDATSAVQEMIP